MRFLMLFLITGCTTNNYVTNNYGVPQSDSLTELDPIEVCPSPVSADAFAIDLYGVDGHTMVFNVSAEQAVQMDADGMPVYGFADIYEINESSTYADNMIVVDGSTGACADFGKVELWEKGQSSARPWAQIPSLRFDMDQFVDGQTLGAYEHGQIHNGQVGGIFREAVAVRVWSELGYPAPAASFVWAQSSVWGSDVRVPYTNVQVYKRAWCDENANRIGGDCVNIWEGGGDLIFPGLQCQSGSYCDNTSLARLQETLSAATPGPGFMEATASVIDWSAFQQFQCLSWMTGTGDDYNHNGNNIVVLERPDGKFMLLPYSMDISAGQEWYPFVDLPGMTFLPSGCQADPACWSQLLDTCDNLIDRFEALNPAQTIVNPVHATLTELDMMRAGDEGRYSEIYQWYTKRAGDLRTAMQTYRDPCFVWDPIPWDTGVPESPCDSADTATPPDTAPTDTDSSAP